MNWRYSEIEELFGDIPTEDEKAKRIADHLVHSLNTRVSKNDTLIILGDVGDVSYISKLKSWYKVLVKGNHDKGGANYIRKTGYLYVPENTTTETLQKDIEFFVKTFNSAIIKDNVKQKIAYYDNYLFDEVYSGPLIISDKILLSHEPVEGPWFNIHGHIHDEDYVDGFKELNVTCEKRHFLPVSLKTIINSGRLSAIDNIHRITIDKAARKE